VVRRDGSDETASCVLPDILTLQNLDAEIRTHTCEIPRALVERALVELDAAHSTRGRAFVSSSGLSGPP
jgi:hypothetical protein